MLTRNAKSYPSDLIVRKLRARFIAGQWPVDQVIPSEHELSEEFQVCRATINKSLKELEREGLLRSHKGKGRFVNQVPAKPQTWCLGLLVMDLQYLSHPVVSQQIAGIRSVVSETNYHMKIFAHNRASRAQIRHVGPGIFMDIVDVAGIDGLILMSHWVSDEQAIELASMIPVVWMMHSDILPSIWGVNEDIAGGMFDATRHLLELGHQRIGLITLLDQVAQGRDQRVGAKLAFRKHQQPNSGALEIGTVDHNSPAEGLRVGRMMLQATPRPTAIIAGSDDLALGILQAAAEMGLKIPDDLSIVGWNDVLAPPQVPVPMTSVLVDYVHIGQVSARRLLTMIEHPDQPGTCPEIGTRLIVRQSTAPPAKAIKSTASSR